MIYFICRGEMADASSCQLGKLYVCADSNPVGPILGMFNAYRVLCFPNVIQITSFLSTHFYRSDFKHQPQQ